jgi:hypothetical protein
VVEITARIGITGGHAQWQVEVRDPVQGVLLGMASGPHRETHRWDRWIAEVDAELIAALAQLTSPFPF